MKIINSPTLAYIVYRTFFHPTEQKIFEISEFENGWHYGEGVKFSKGAIKDILALHRELVLKGCFNTDVFPGLNGELQITVYSGKDCVIFERSIEGLWDVTHEINDEESESVQGLSLQEAVEHASVLKSKLCNASASYRSVIIGTKSGTASTIWPSSPLARMEEFPLSI